MTKSNAGEAPNEMENMILMMAYITFQSPTWVRNDNLQIKVRGKNPLQDLPRSHGGGQAASNSSNSTCKRIEVEEEFKRMKSRKVIETDGVTVQFWKTQIWNLTL